jgi:hypothetical protein
MAVTESIVRNDLRSGTGLRSAGISARCRVFQQERIHAVRRILTHSKYNGWLTYAKTSRKRHTKELKMPESGWLRIPHPSAKIIDDVTFASVPQHLATFTINKSDEQLVDELRSIWAMHGRLIPTRFALLRALLLQPLAPPIWFPDAGLSVLRRSSESRDPVRTEKGAFRAVAIPGEREMD